MKKHIYSILLLLVTLLGANSLLTSCQDLDEPQNNIPVLVTGDAELSGNVPCLFGSVADYNYSYSSGEYYFLVSTHEDMSDAVRCFAEYSGDDFYAYVYDIDFLPATTYYYVFCGTDGFIELRGEVKSFTTLDALHINSVTYTPWGEESPVDFVDETALGGFLFYGSLSGDIWQNNLMIPYDFDNAEWSLPELDSFEGDMAMIAYWPYRQSATPWEFEVYNGTDYMYGTCEGLNASNLAADIHLNHVMAKVNFSISLEGENTVGGTIRTVVIGNHDNPETYSRYEAIPWEGLLNMTTNTLTPYYNSHDGVWIECNIAPSTEPQTVGTFIVPTKFDADMAYVELQFDNDYLLSWTFPDTSWESGYEYTYELIITENGLRLGDVIVEEWHDNDEGTIIINK
ncbi:fimbrillin family protein [Bacteroides caecigallinarum]|uniref:fimbrillin family protein n=1 Tax=Bacteroides caecigallinarum TaxID=1411144 RepID=UPI001F2C3DF1|nr:fimbrillin family protein [Bacteroides caecigallinarum]MCF2551034.1 fimbrillin family protein [Bacteroides caecigallinarum]